VELILLAEKVNAEFLHRACLYFVVKNLGAASEMLKDPRITKETVLRVMELSTKIDKKWYDDNA